MMFRLRFAPGSLLIAAVLALSSASAAGAPLGGTRADELKALAVELAVEGARARREAVDWARQMGWLVRKEFPDGRVVELQRLGPFGEPVYYTTLNADAADSVGTDELWPGGSRGLGLTGSGMELRRSGDGQRRSRRTAAVEPLLRQYRGLVRGQFAHPVLEVPATCVA